MLYTKPSTATVQEMLDKFIVKELIEFERFCRDHCLWEQMHACFAEDSTVTVSWYQGNGHGFVEESKKMKTKAPHKLNNTLVWLNGERAAAVTMANIQTRNRIDGKEYDLLSYVRFLYTAQKRNGEWLIVSMDCIYEKDSLIPVIPECFTGQQRPERIRESYGALSMVLEMEGYAIANDLPGDDNGEAVKKLIHAKNNWLCGEE